MSLTRFYTLAAFAAVILAPAAGAQSPSPDSPEYDAWKASLAPSSADAQSGPHDRAPAARSKSTAAGLLIPFATDGTWTALPANDDGSVSVSFGFDLEFYGDTYAGGSINNNGNITLNGSFSGFSSTGFPFSGRAMIAPFWADVDTRGAGSGIVYYKQTIYNGQPVFVAHWEAVGYYNRQTDKLNTFQVVLADNATLPGGSNIYFGYGAMNWTTGNASSGSGGFGGIPATAGVNQGDGSRFFQIGRFDQLGSYYDGPSGDNDGVGYLTGQSFGFNTGASAENVPPSPRGISNGDVVDVTAGTPSASLNFSFLSPESDQTTTITLVDAATTDGSLTAFPGTAALSATAGNPATATASFSTPAGAPAGDYFFDITGTDNGSPVASTTVRITVRVTSPAACDLTAPLAISGFTTSATDVTNTSGDTTVDLSACTVAAFDGYAETVSAAVDPTDVLAPGASANVALAALAGPGAVVVSTAPLAAGSTVADAAGSIVAAVVYDATGSVFVAPDGTRGECGNGPGLAACNTPEGGAAVATAMASVFGGAVTSEGGPDGHLAVGVWPNPTAGRSTVAFGLAEGSDVRVSVVDALGREVAVLADGAYPAGRHEASVEAAALPAGVYVVRMAAGGNVQTARFTVAR